MTESIINLVEEYDKIIIFRHLEGDGDALGSQWGLYYFLKDKYPHKEIYAVGDETKGYAGVYPEPHDLSEGQYKGALAIIVDTANQERISGKFYVHTDKIIKIDHHLPVDNYGVINLVDEKRSSCAEIVTELLKAWSNDQALVYEAAYNLYSGIASDTQGFSISSVNSKTFMMAAYLMESEINPSEISRKLRQVDLQVFKFQAYATSKITYVSDSFAYLEISQADLSEYNLDVQEVKFLVNVMRPIKGLKVWGLFIEVEPELYSGSLRSHGININAIASLYGGGGHLQASGVKNLTPVSKADIINDLLAVSK